VAGDLMRQLNREGGLVRTGGLYTIVVVHASLATINLMLAFSLFS